MYTIDGLVPGKTVQDDSSTGLAIYRIPLKISYLSYALESNSLRSVALTIVQWWQRAEPMTWRKTVRDCTNKEFEFFWESTAEPCSGCLKEHDYYTVPCLLVAALQCPWQVKCPRLNLRHRQEGKESRRFLPRENVLLSVLDSNSSPRNHEWWVRVPRTQQL